MAKSVGIASLPAAVRAAEVSLGLRTPVTLYDALREAIHRVAMSHDVGDHGPLPAGRHSRPRLRPVFRLRSARSDDPGWTCPPQYESLPYELSAALVDTAYDVAELLKHDRYYVETLIVATEFMVYAASDHGDHVDAAVGAARRKTATVRVEFVADDGPYQPLSVCLIEFASADDAALVAAASDRRDWPDEIQLAVAARPLCAVLRIDFRANDEPFEETVDSLERFRVGLLAAIG